MTRTSSNQLETTPPIDCTCIQIDSREKTVCSHQSTYQDVSEMRSETLNPKQVKAKKHGLPSSRGLKTIRNELHLDNTDCNDCDERQINRVYTISNGEVGGNESSKSGAGVQSNKLPKLSHTATERRSKEGFFKRMFCSQTGPNNVKLLVAEFMGTGLLMFLGCMGCAGTLAGSLPGFMAAVSFGLTVMLIIQMFGHISGAHLNPAVTMVAAMSGMIEMKSVPFYLLGEFAGAICGLGLLKILLPSEYNAQDFFEPISNQTIHKTGLCTTFVNSKLTTVQGLGLEIIITFVLIFMCYAIWDKRNEAKQDSVPIRFGLFIACVGMAAGPLSGGSMNTARSFAPALLNNDWEDHWIYWVGPTTGALIAHFFYKLIYSVPDEKHDVEYDEVSLKATNKEDAKV